MKYLVFILLSIVLFTSCKKYENDEFISTFSPLKRLTASSEENIYWVLEGVKDAEGVELFVPSNLYNLRFETSGQLFFQWAPYIMESYSYVPSEIYRSSDEWSFNTNKEKLIFFGNEYDILKLTVNDLELKSSSDLIYTFKKKAISSISNMDNVVSTVPLMGIFSNSSNNYKLVWSNSMNSQGGVSLQAQASLNGSTNTGPVPCSIQSSSLLGNAYVSDNPNTTSSSCTFSRFFENKGHVSFFFRKSNGGVYADEWPQVKVNGIIVQYEYDATAFDSDPNWGWYKLIVPVNVTGTVGIQVIGGPKVANGIDEIRQWEIIE
jgi:hypothetical protein